MKTSSQEAMARGHLTVDGTGSILDADEVWCQMTGFDRADLCLGGIETSFMPDGCRLIRHYIGGAEHPYTAMFETSYRLKNGTLRRAKVSVQRESSSYSITLDDMERAEENRYRSMLMQYTIEWIADMIIWLDEDGRYVYVNPATTRLLGYSAEELRLMTVWDVDPLFDQHRWRDHWREIVERKSFKIETVNRSKAGRDIPIEVTVNLVEYGGKRYNCSIVRDISERKAAETELRRLNEHILRLSITDGLTGLGNRGHFDAVLEREVEQAQPFSLIMLDVDCFKAFNDRYGHLAGDDCLRRVASVLSRGIPSPDSLAARYGGEEFACILPGIGADAALAIAEKLRQDIEDLGIAHAAARIGQVVTASFGVTTADSSRRQTSQTLLHAVDTALYRAKRAGGNRVARGV